MGATESKLNLFSFSGKMRILHLSWFAFFLSFFVWFNHAPLLPAIQAALSLSDPEVKTLLILNVALTIPARIIIGMLVDKYGPKIVFTTVLIFSSIPCFMFAMADTFEQLALARFLLGGIGAGFVIGIRMISEWFPAKEVGLAEGIYGGWGNFGSAAAALLLPTLAFVVFGGDNGWRYAIATTGILALVYAFIYYNSVHDTPKGSTYFKPKKIGAMEVTNKRDLLLYIIMTLPMYVALAVLTWKLSPVGVNLLAAPVAYTIYTALTVLYIVNVRKIIAVNKEHLNEAVPEIHQYKFKQVAILNLAYMVSFGSELAVVSMLPLLFHDIFDLSVVWAGVVASIFAGLNLVARPTGGWISDKIGRRSTMLIVFAGIAVGYFLMGQINASWPIALAVTVTIIASLFVNGANGAVFAVVPLIRRRMTGQIAGMTGAYGNVGAVSFLTVLSFVEPKIFFYVIACSALVVFVASLFLEEPKGHMAEILPDGTVQMIEVE